MLRKIAKAISVSRAWVLAFAFLAPLEWSLKVPNHFKHALRRYITIPQPRISRKVFPLSRRCSLSTVIVLGISLTTTPKQSFAAFTIILSFSTIYLWLATRDLVTGSERTTRQQLRAYVFFEKGHIKLVTANGQQFIAAETRFKNFGQTPAYKFKSWVAINFCESSAQPFGGKADGATESVIGPGGAIDSNVFR